MLTVSGWLASFRRFRGPSCCELGCQLLCCQPGASRLALSWIVPWWSQSQDPTWLAHSLVLPCPTLTLSVWPPWQVSLCDLSSKMTGCVIMVGSRFSKHKKLKQPVLLRAWPRDQCRIDSCSVLGVVTGPAQAQHGWEYEWIYTRFSLVVSVTLLCINR